jgi:hypothetical protein
VNGRREIRERERERERGRRQAVTPIRFWLASAHRCLHAPARRRLHVAIPLDGEYPGSDLLNGGAGLSEEVVRGAGLGLRYGGRTSPHGGGGREEGAGRDALGADLDLVT